MFNQRVVLVPIHSSLSDPSVGVFYDFVPQYFGLSRKIMEDGSKVRGGDMIRLE